MVLLDILAILINGNHAMQYTVQNLCINSAIIELSNSNTFFHFLIHSTFYLFLSAVKAVTTELIKHFHDSLSQIFYGIKMVEKV